MAKLDNPSTSDVVFSRTALPVAGNIDAVGALS
jgi:hypothetical protein